jgi:hypothetical protein
VWFKLKWWSISDISFPVHITLLPIVHFRFILLISGFPFPFLLISGFSFPVLLFSFFTVSGFSFPVVHSSSSLFFINGTREEWRKGKALYYYSPLSIFLVSA